MSIVPNKIETLQRLLRERIVIIDGAMGTMIQQHKLAEADYRGARRMRSRRRSPVACALSRAQSARRQKRRPSPRT